ncbi:DUF418 domain-containing protein [Labrys neptuniae]
MSHTPSPDRLAEVDALRGFALFGILVVNIIAFASVYYGRGVTDPAFTSLAGRLAEGLVSFVFETKFYLIFSFLFGYSFTLQMRSAERAGEALVPRMARRQIGLWLIGLTHAVLLYHGDILTTYAVLGLLLLMLRRWSDASALRLAAGLILVTGLAWALLGWLQLLAGDTADLVAVQAEAAAALAAFGGTPGTVIAAHLQELDSIWALLSLLQAPSALAMFLCGLVAGRRRLFEQGEEIRPLIRRLLRLALLIGLPGSVIYTYTSMAQPGTGWEVVGLAVSILTGPFLAGGYIAAVLLLFRSAFGGRLVAALAPAGRMALSNYLGQSLACSLIFTAYGLRLVGQVPPWGVLAIALTLYLSQLVFSAWWLRRHAYGPLEWALRALTIARWPAWRAVAVRSGSA